MSIITLGLSKTRQTLVTGGLGETLFTSRNIGGAHGISYPHFQHFLRNNLPIEFYIGLEGITENPIKIEYKLAGIKVIPVSFEFDTLGIIKEYLDREIFISGVKESVFRKELINLLGSKFLDINEEISLKGKRDIYSILEVMELI